MEKTLKLGKIEGRNRGWHRMRWLDGITNLMDMNLSKLQGTSCEMPGWMKNRLESRLPGEIAITSDVQITSPLWQKAKRN